MARSDSNYEESEPEHEKRPRLALRFGKSLLNKAEIVDPKRASAGTRMPPQDPIYETLLSRPADNKPPLKKQRVDARSVPAPAVNDKRYILLVHLEFFHFNVC
jgi:hypothetical protein